MSSAPPDAADPCPWIQSRGAILLGSAAVAIPIILFYAGKAWPVVASVIALEGLTQAVYFFACYSAGAFILKRLRRPTTTALGVSSAAAIGFALLGFLTLALGLAGWLSTTTAFAALALAAALGLWDLLKAAMRRRSADPAAAAALFLRRRSNGGWYWLPAAAAVGLCLLAATLMPGALWRPDDPHPYDSLIYHLQVPREWFELGRIAPLAHNVYSYFPFNIETHYLLASYLRGGPWAAMYQAQFLSLSLTLLTAAAIWGEVAARASRRAAALAVLAFLTLPWVLMLACVSYVESGMLLFAALAILHLLDGLRSAARMPFALAGLFAGLACGAKLTNVPLLLIGLPLLTALLFLSPGNGAAILKRTALFLLCGLLSLAPWLLRTAVWAGGNPFFPVAARQLGQAHFSDTQVERFERAHRPAPAHAPWPARWSRVASEIALNWRYGYVLFPLALLAIGLRPRRREAWLLLALIGLLLLFWLTQTHLMGRFFILAAVPAVLLVASLPPRTLNWAAAALTVAAAIGAAGPTLLAFTLLTAPPSPGADLHSLLAPYAREPALFGLSDYSALQEPELRSIADSGRDVVFVGDAAMFMQPIPMSRLHYATVFDLDTAHRGWVDASYGPPMAKCPPSAAVVVSPSECRRLQQTYYALPPLDLPAPGEYWRLLLR